MAKPPKYSGKKIWCLGCEDYLPRFKFRRFVTGTTPPPRCKECTSQRAHEIRMANTYGINAEIYQQIFDYQGGVCYICLSKSVKRRLAVDHDHKTGEVRGLLCRRCNRDILGHFARDQVDVLQRAIDYLNDPPTRRIARLESNMVTEVEDGSA